MSYKEDLVASRILQMSVLNIKTSDITINTIWDTTTCQDILHSLYCTHTALKKLESTSAISMIVKLRPFFLKYHSKLFKNTTAIGKTLHRKARWYTSRKIRRSFRDDFNILRNTLMD